jgi:hypothetical protein
MIVVGPRYTTEELERYLRVDASSKKAVRAIHHHFILSPTASPALEKFSLLVSTETKFLDSWEHRRLDFQDQSASCYDLSLASYALRARWSSQETVDLLIAHRRKHGEDLKLREDYYQATLRKAAESTIALERERLAEHVRAGGELPPEVTRNRAEILAIHSQNLGIHVTRVVCYKATPNTYAMEIDGRMIKIGPIKNLMKQWEFRKLIADEMKRVIPSHNKEIWERIINGLLRCTEDEECGPEATELGALEERLRAYLDEQIYKEEDWDVAIQRERPCYKGDHIFFSLVGLRQYLRQGLGASVEHENLAVQLKQLGAIPKSENYRKHRDGRSKKRMWALEKTFIAI